MAEQIGSSVTGWGSMWVQSIICEVELSPEIGSLAQEIVTESVELGFVGDSRRDCSEHDFDGFGDFGDQNGPSDRCARATNGCHVQQRSYEVRECSS